jgi:hypothetical protein
MPRVTSDLLVADILKEAEETDRWEDGLFGADRGDELPEHLRTEEGRRAAFKAAKERLAKKAGRGEEPEVARIEPDPEQFSATHGVGSPHVAPGSAQGVVAPARAGGTADRALPSWAAVGGAAPSGGEPAGRGPGERGL